MQVASLHVSPFYVASGSRCPVRDDDEAAARLLEKGARVSLLGELYQDAWHDNESGEERHKLRLRADPFDLDLARLSSVTRHSRAEETRLKASSSPYCRISACILSAPTDRTIDFGWGLPPEPQLQSLVPAIFFGTFTLAARANPRRVNG
jgi:hypothetical protein